VFDHKQCGPYFDQEGPERPLLGMIADHDVSEPYELDAAAVFAVDPDGYLVVGVSGCSCWPDRGGTTQTFCADRAAVDRALTGDWRALLQKCQDADWAIKGG
jgi:hypothetical protein